MRKIIFRGRDKETGTWHYGYLKRGKDTIIGMWLMDNGEPIAPCEIIVDTQTVCQFTGVYDCNGKEIYEGDIISFNGGKSIGEVAWTVGQYYIDCDDFDCVDESGSFIDILKSHSTDTIDGKVIGNIYEGINNAVSSS